MRLEFEREVIISFAGLIAEIWYANKENPLEAHKKLREAADEWIDLICEFPDDDYEGDLDTVCSYYKWFWPLTFPVRDPDTDHFYFDWLWHRTINIITDKQTWAAVDAIAKRLVKTGIIERRDLYPLLKENVSSTVFHLMHCSPKEIKNRHRLIKRVEASLGMSSTSDF